MSSSSAGVRYVIYGAGAVGGVIGAKLFAAGSDVTLIARGEHLTSIQRGGLTIETPHERVTLAVPAFAHPSEVSFTEDHVVLMTMKTQDSEAALDELRAAAGGRVPVICAQNGVENERLALRRFERVYAMLVILPATFLEPGIVQSASSAATGILDSGRYPSGDDDLIARVMRDLVAAGFAAVPRADIMRWKYAKLLSNLGNVLQAACGLDASGAAGVYRQLREEALACYAAANIDCASNEEMRERQEGVMKLGEIGGQRRQGGSSWQSLARGAGSIETDYLNGEITLLGRVQDVPTPANAAMQRIAERMIREHMPAGAFTVSEVEAEIAAPELSERTN